MEFVKISSKAFTALVANKIELQYLPSLSINYVAIGKDLKKITTTSVLDKDENVL